MAKRLGKLIVLAAVAGAVAAGVSYVLQYKSFHKELDEDFHEFEDDFDDFDDDEEEKDEKEEASAKRNYVSINPEQKKAESEEEVKSGEETPAEKKEDAPAEEPKETPAEEPQADEKAEGDAPAEDGEKQNGENA